MTAWYRWQPVPVLDDSRSHGHRRRRRLVAAQAAVLALAAACASSTPSPSSGPGGTATAPASPQTSSPATSATPSIPPASASPVPTGTPGTGHWEGAGTLGWPRSEPTAVRLGDGSVLVVGEAGGKYEGPPEMSRFAEVWDPAGSWTETEFLPKARGAAAATSLLDGRALIAGGVNARWQSYSSAYVYDPATRRWTKTGLMGTARAAPAAAVLADGRVLVAGGAYWTGVTAESQAGRISLAEYGPGATGDAGAIWPADTWPGPSGRALATAELFDPQTLRWSSTGPMRYARIGASAVTLADGRVLVVGGDDGRRFIATAEVYDPTSGRFSRVSAVSSGAFDGRSLVALADGDAILIGWRWEGDEMAGTTVYRFQAVTGSWTERSWDVLYPYGGFVALTDGRVLAFGGMEGDGYPTYGSRDAALYEPGSEVWTWLPPMPGSRMQAAAVALADGSALVIGGYSNPGDGWPVALGDTFRYVP